MVNRCYTGSFLALLVGGAGVPARAQWDPSSGQWGKSGPNDVRVMTYNICDHICRNTDKSEGYNPWHALARIVAAMRPDILLFQEAGDNDGNGTPGGVDSVAQLQSTLELFFHGGADPFLGGTVGAYVQKYAPDYDLPYIWVSSLTDGYNRNVTISRFPFGDLNGDGVGQRPLPAAILPDAYAPGPPTVIRGFMFGELDLPDGLYAGDLVVGNGHLKSGSAQSDLDQREHDSRNMAYYIDYLFNGNGGSIPDPNNKISDSPPATEILDPDTPVVFGGDWNEDELTNGRKGPAEWLTCAELTGGGDGTDRDRSDSTYDSSVEPYSGSRVTSSGKKLDYLAWQDSIVILRRSFVFYSDALQSVPAWIPAELNGFPNGAYRPSGLASDHRPVIADFVLPAPPTWPLGDMNCDGTVSFGDINPFVLALSNPAAYQAAYPGCPIMNGDINKDGQVGFADINPFVALLGGPRS